MGSRARGNGRIDVVAPRSKSYQGPFGRIFGDLPPWDPGVSEVMLDDHLLTIANTLMVEVPATGGNAIPSPGDIAGDGALVDSLESQFGSKTPAGYTYFGQFIDHDVTFDTASSLQRANDPNALLNFRTPRLDLDNLYGRGPADQPYMFDDSPHERAKFLIGEVDGTGLKDLPRNANGRALIGDMRNDENSMVSQLQLAFLLAHNTLVDRAVAAGSHSPFEDARKTLRWLYQWIVWHDWVKKICIDDVHKAGLSLEDRLGGRKIWRRRLGDVYSWSVNPYIPVEFSVAAYRFGHSMVRNAYQTNESSRNGARAPIFDNTGAVDDPDDLRGFRAMKAENSLQWGLFLPMSQQPGGDNPQMARKIDTKLSNALTFLHEGGSGDRLNVLAFRNLKRGWAFDLPAGTAVARHLCVPETTIDDDEPDALWYYILKEAASLPGANGGQMLGRVGSIIVCATFAGLLEGDPRSFINIDPCWEPSDDPLLHDGDDNQDNADWTLESIIRLSGLPVTATDFEAQL